MDFENYPDSVELLKEKKSDTCLNWICLTPFTKYVLPSFVLALVVLTSTYFSMLTWLPQAEDSQSTCHLQASYYVPCLSGRKITAKNCSELGCCWRDDLKLCYHAFPSRYGYKLDRSPNGANEDGIISALRQYSPSGKPIREKLAFNVYKLYNNHTRITLKTSTKSDSQHDKATSSQTFTKRNASFNKLLDFGHLFDFLPPDEQARISKLSSGENSAVDVLVHEPNFSITLARHGEGNATASGTVVLSTARGPLIVTEDYWEWTLYLTNGTLYGLNNLELNGTSNWIYNNENETTKPAFLAIDPFGNAMSCFINYTGPLEVQVLNGSNLVILRGLSVPEELSIDVMSGPTGLLAARQLAGAEGRRTASLLPSSLQGMQLCPELENPTAAEALERLRDSIRWMSLAKAPWDSHCLYRGLGLALEHELSGSALVAREARQLLLEEGKSFATHLTPMLFNKVDGTLQGNLKKESCLLRNGSLVYLGMYEGRSVVYPDWTKSETHELARSSLDKYKSDLTPDLIVLRDSWPKDDTENEFLDTEHFGYLPEGLQLLVSRHTVPLYLEGRHYAHHNSYASQFAEFVGEGASSAVVELRGHECNSNGAEASWPALRKILQAGIVSAMLGQLPTAMYVCGADDATVNEELCIRWYGAAVAWPRIMVLPEKSPGGTQLSRTGSLQAAKLLTLRASLATYQHTVLAHYLQKGFPILSALSIFYPDERQPRNTTYNQFFWGDSILVGLVLYPRQNQVTMWLPGKFSWKHLEGGSPLNSTGNGTVQITASYNQIITLVRPGRIIPIHKEVSGSTSETKRKNLKLLANLVCIDEVSCQADGSIYYGDDGVGEFLLVQVANASLLTLKNMQKVREAAACSSPTRKQATFLETLQILGGSPFTINQDLCDITLDSCTIDLTLPVETPTCIGNSIPTFF